MTTITEILLSDKFKNDPRKDLFNKWCAQMPEDEEDKIIEFLSDVTTEVIKLKLDEFGIEYEIKNS